MPSSEPSSERNRRSRAGTRADGAASGGADPAPSGGGALIAQYVLALAILAALGIVTVWQHTRAVRAGYRLGALEEERVELREQVRKLEARQVEESRLDKLEARARELHIRLPGEDPEVYELLR